jgi:hypothetical protein
MPLGALQLFDTLVILSITQNTMYNQQQVIFP